MQIVEFKVYTTLPVLTSNFDEVKANLMEYLAKYDIEVTHETVKDAKKLATELNSICKKGEDSVKEKLKVFESPINIVKSQLKEIVSLYQDARLKILDQVKVFEDKTREQCRKLLIEERDASMQEYNIDSSDFVSPSIDDLIIISNVTENGNLTKKAKDEVSFRVNQVFQVVQKIKFRLLELENASLKAGLKSPLERRHVESFLKADDEVYKAQLNKFFENEIRRQKEIEAQILFEEKRKQEIRETQIRAEEESKRKIEVERVRKEEEQKRIEQTKQMVTVVSVPDARTRKEHLEAQVRVKHKNLKISRMNRL